MIHHPIAFFILAVAAGLLGFGLLDGPTAEMAKMSSSIFASLFVFSIIFKKQYIRD